MHSAFCPRQTSLIAEQFPGEIYHLDADPIPRETFDGQNKLIPPLASDNRELNADYFPISLFNNGEAAASVSLKFLQEQ